MHQTRETHELVSFERREMAKRFATLRTLDQSPLDPSIAFQVTQARQSGTDLPEGPGLSSKVKSEKAKAAAKREPVVFPLELKDGFFESDGARDFVGGFLAKYALYILISILQS